MVGIEEMSETERGESVKVTWLVPASGLRLMRAQNEHKDQSQMHEATLPQ